MPPHRRRPPAPPSAELLALAALEGRVDHFTFRSEDGTFAIARIQTAGGPAKIKGDLLGVTLGMAVRVEGEWRQHEQHGWTFDVRSCLALQPTGEDDLRGYLGSGAIKQVGPAWAAKLVAHFGEGLVQVLDEAPERLLEIDGMGRRRAEAIATSWRENRERHEVMVILRSNGITGGLAARLVRHYGKDAARILKADPHRVALEVPLIGFLRADAIASKLGIAPESPQRLRAGLVHVLVVAQEQGHTHLTRDDLLARAAELLRVDPALLPEAVDAAALEGWLRIETLPDGTAAAFTKALYRSESGVARIVGRLSRSARPVYTGDTDAAVDAFEAEHRFRLADNQRAALRAIAGGGVVVITGGPGTGKTTLLRALLWMLRDAPTRVALCSPTGRAAQRLAEATREDAATIHRLLRYNAATGGFVHEPSNPVGCDLMIVDEASMIDIPLAWHLLRAVPPGATVVLVGDIDQLPSVGPGAFLGDLIRSGTIRTVRLDHIFRQAARSLIIQNSHRINRGDMPMTTPPDGAEADFFFIPREEPEAARDAVLAMVADRIPARYGLDALGQVQVLCPMRRGILGTMELNRALQERLNPEGTPIPGPAGFRVGDKVIQTQNNYDLDVFNGDTGRITGHDEEGGGLRVMFGRRLVLYPADMLDQLEPAYAITIHKSQGSEYGAVVIPIHTTHYVMLKRNLLYTGVTRGRKLVVLVGTTRALALAVRNVSEQERRTALAQWLPRPPEAEEELSI